MTFWGYSLSTKHAKKVQTDISRRQAVKSGQAAHSKMGGHRQDQSRIGRLGHQTVAEAPAPYSFLNIPFDKSFEPVALAIMTLCVAGRLIPRIVSDRRSGGIRLNKLVPLIRDATWMLSDLTPVRSKWGPRLNMGIEAGIGIGVSEHARLIFLDRRPYRLQRIATDLNAFDPIIYRRGQEVIVIRELLLDLAPQADILAVLRLYSTCRKNLRRILAQHQQTSLFSPAGWTVTLASVAGLWDSISQPTN